MSQFITATFENGVLKPDQPLELANGARVRLIVEPVLTKEDKENAWVEWDKLCDEIKLEESASRLTRDQLHERR
jgi:predicted DNA-binding antitoxin AbrB/MazE fold protein